jgi:hypothetical protein
VSTPERNRPCACEHDGSWYEPSCKCCNWQPRQRPLAEVQASVHRTLTEARLRDAEAKLAAIEAACRNPERTAGRRMGGMHIPGDRLAEHVLAIIGTEGES